jgi:hypothetical protein
MTDKQQDKVDAQPLAGEPAAGRRTPGAGQEQEESVEGAPWRT